MLLHNIGRGNLFSGVGAVDHGSILSQNSFGSDTSFGSGNYHPSSNGPWTSSFDLTNTGALPFMPDVSCHQMNIGMQNFNPYELSDPTLNGQFQDLWTHLSQNPQLLNAISMGLLRNCDSGIGNVQSLPNTMMGNAFTNPGALQQSFPQNFPFSNGNGSHSPISLQTTFPNGEVLLRDCFSSSRIRQTHLFEIPLMQTVLGGRNIPYS